MFATARYFVRYRSISALSPYLRRAGLCQVRPRCNVTKSTERLVLAALNTICPSCGFSISPAEAVRIDFERMLCPKCGHAFEVGNSRKPQEIAQAECAHSMLDVGRVPRIRYEKLPFLCFSAVLFGIGVGRATTEIR